MSKTKITRLVESRPEEIDARKWCIEQATRWPSREVYSPASPGAFGAVYNQAYAGRHTVDVDLIARAELIWAWINK